MSLLNQRMLPVPDVSCDCLSQENDITVQTVDIVCSVVIPNDTRKGGAVFIKYCICMF